MIHLRRRRGALDPVSGHGVTLTAKVIPANRILLEITALRRVHRAVKTYADRVFALLIV